MINIYFYSKQIILIVFLLSIVFLNCSPENPSVQGKAYFLGTWESNNGCFKKIEFSQPIARMFLNYRECLSDTIANPDQYIDSCYIDYVQDSFLVNNFKSWDISQTESGGTIIFYDTCFSSKAPQERSFDYETISNNQFYLISYFPSTPTLKILFIKK
jgi:hypothetical protein